MLAGRNARSARPAGRASSAAQPRVFRWIDRPRRSAGQLTGMSRCLIAPARSRAPPRPLMDACLAATCDYLDITGEIDVIEAAPRAARASRAGRRHADAGRRLRRRAHRLPGRHARRAACPVPSAWSWRSPSPAASAAARPRPCSRRCPTAAGRASTDGSRRVPVAWKATHSFRDRPRWAMTIPWGDVASAFYTTGIPNIEVYAAAPRSQIRMAAC